MSNLSNIIPFNRHCSVSLLLDRLAGYLGGELSLLMEIALRVGVGVFTTIPEKLDNIAAQAQNPNANQIDVGIEAGALLVLLLDIRVVSA